MEEDSGGHCKVGCDEGWIDLFYHEICGNRLKDEKRSASTRFLISCEGEFFLMDGVTIRREALSTLLSLFHVAYILCKCWFRTRGQKNIDGMHLLLDSTRNY